VTRATADVGRVVISCPDQHGIVAAVATTLASLDANIISSAQHSTDAENGTFFLRMAFHLHDLAARMGEVEARLGDVAERFGMSWQLRAADYRPRTAVFVSRRDHCLHDLLWRWRDGELSMDLTHVVSNHPDHEEIVAAAGVPYHHIPVPAGSESEAEERTLEILGGDVDLIVLARYMRILSPAFLDAVGVPIINIHHSFLPAFAGGAPYAQAHQRGVKLIGATAHYVTEDLDQGPIIEQDVQRVTHAHTPAELARVGRDLERVVLARAVRWHCEDRVMVDGGRTVVFQG
jgi:formyltetrahydrofolate deformylase